MMKMKLLLTAMAIVALATVSASAGIIGELGILDSSTGLNPGDQYRIAFLSTGTITGESADIATYNAFVQGLATTAGLGGTWNIIGSTATVDARDNTGTNPTLDGIGVPVFLMDGTSLYAADNADLWNGGNSIYLDIDENGDQVTSNVDRIIAGTMNDGTAHSWQFLGSIGDGGTQPPKVQTGRADVNPNGWIQNFNVKTTDSKRVYALSDTLTAVPEPATMLLLGLGGLVLRRRRA